jgi:hypothetical protein
MAGRLSVGFAVRRAAAEVSGSLTPPDARGKMELKVTVQSCNLMYYASCENVNVSLVSRNGATSSVKRYWSRPQGIIGIQSLGDAAATKKEIIQDAKQSDKIIEITINGRK